MKSLISTVVKDVRLQVRYGFYFATVFVAIIYIAIIKQLPPASLATILPLLLLSNLTITAYFFVAGLILFEKGESILEALVVTPLPPTAYLTAKIISLSILALVENLLIAGITTWFGFNLPLLATGLILNATIMVLMGFIVVVRFDSINEFIIPGALLMTIFSVPLVDYLGLFQHWLFYIHPVTAPLKLMGSAFSSNGELGIWLGVISSLIWIGLLFNWARRDFRQFVILGRGQR
ncbi:MAG: ABC transporter permease [Candidatus Marinimicrobia bacterium]|nr:ABC transporter permease [Candidatus Neomarinimicrobiota bacterium]